MDKIGNTSCELRHSGAASFPVVLNFSDTVDLEPICVLPPYYAAPNDVFVNKPADPCKRKREEDYGGKRWGLDNDGDGRYDRRDQGSKEK